jgi:hypothetical protein
MRPSRFCSEGGSIVKDQTTSQHPDTIMLDFIASEYLDVSAFAMPTGAGDADVGWKLAQEHEGKKGRVEVACHYRDDLRGAIREAMQALGHTLSTSDSAAGNQKPNELTANADVSAYIASLVEDAERYRWLRQQYWNNAPLCVVAQPKQAVKLGHDCPSLDRLDAAIDAARKALK